MEDKEGIMIDIILGIIVWGPIVLILWGTVIAGAISLYRYIFEKE